MAASQLVTVTRPLIVTTANRNPFTIEVGTQITVAFRGWCPIRKGGIYEVSGRIPGLRYFPDFEPTVRVDRLHRAVAHTSPLYWYCHRCQGTGRNLWTHNYGDRRSLDGPHCKACSGTGHTRTYPANVTAAV